MRMPMQASSGTSSPVATPGHGQLKTCLRCWWGILWVTYFHCFILRTQYRLCFNVSRCLYRPTHAVDDASTARRNAIR